MRSTPQVGKVGTRQAGRHSAGLGRSARVQRQLARCGRHGRRGTAAVARRGHGSGGSAGGTTGSGGAPDRRRDRDRRRGREPRASAARGRGGAGGAGAGAPARGRRHAAVDGLAVRFANAVMARWPDPRTSPAAERLGVQPRHRPARDPAGLSHTCDARYLTYIQRYADEFVSAAGTVNIPADHSFDNIQPSVLLPLLTSRRSWPSTTPPPTRFAPATTASRPTPTAASGTSRPTRTRCGSTASTWASRS